MGETPSQHDTNPTESDLPEQSAAQPPKVTWRIRRPRYGVQPIPGESAKAFRERVMIEFNKNFRRSIGPGYM